MATRPGMSARLLVVDSDKRYGEWLRHHLGVLCPDASVSTLSYRDFERSVEELPQDAMEVVLLSASFGSSPEDPRAVGLEILRRLRELDRLPVLIAVAEEGNELTAVRAMQLGAVDYLPKRLLTPDRLRTSVRLALRRVERRAVRRVIDSGKSGAADAAHSNTDVRTGSVARPIPPLSAVAVSPMQARVGAVPADAGSVSPAVVSAAAEGLAPKSGSAPNTSDVAHEADGSMMSEAQLSAALLGSPVSASGTWAPAFAQSLLSQGAVTTVSDGSSSETATANAAGAQQQATAAGVAAAPGSPSRVPTLPAAIAPGAAVAPDAAAPAAVVPGTDGLPADFIPGYTIHDTVGESEKAAVYVATSATLGHQVAIKVSKTLRDEAAGRQFLEREYRAIVAIRDPSVVRIYDYGIHAGYEYLVMEYFPHGDLKARLQQGLTEQESLRYVEQIAAGLQVVHKAGLVHRDLKPPNVMLRENGDISLIDFGLARSLDGTSASTRTGVLRGSPYYMSPEQALGEILDARSDFYSLGIMYYEMLTGRKPYTGNSAMDVLQQHVNAPVPQLPRALAHHEPLLAKLLAKAREERFSSATELLAAIATAREIAGVHSSAA